MELEIGNEHWANMEPNTEHRLYCGVAAESEPSRPMANGHKTKMDRSVMLT